MEGRIILFDGVCNVCNASVQFAIKRDPKGKFKFAPLQSDVAKPFLEQLGMSLTAFDSVVLIENDKVYTRSSAALRIARQLNGLWPVLYVFIFVPKFIRDFVYDFIGRNRYKWFGKRESCMLPSPEERKRFL